MTLMQRRRALMGAAKEPQLPAEYQAVEWIGVANTSSDNCAYFDLPPEIFRVGYTATLLMHLDGPATTEAGYCGYYAVGSSSPFELYYKNGLSQAWGSIEMVSVDYASAYDTCVARKLARDPEQLWLMTYRLDRYYFAGKCYGATFASESGICVADLVPCYRKVDGTIGMFDLINRMFHANAGTGSFTKGADA